MFKQSCFILFLVFSIAVIPIGVMCQEYDSPDSLEEVSPLVTGLPANHGVVQATAAINKDGTIAGGWYVDPGTTKRIKTGQYQVGFSHIVRRVDVLADITAAEGYARQVQVDGLGLLSIAGYCTTADKHNVPNAVFVECFNTSGKNADTSFFLFLTR